MTIVLYTTSGKNIIKCLEQKAQIQNNDSII